MKIISISLVFLGLLCFSGASLASVLQKGPSEKIVYVDGVYDLAHYGHAKSFAKARRYAAKHFKLPMSKIKLLVGINGSETDSEIAAYKRQPVMSLSQRTREVAAMKGVDGVYSGASLVTTNKFINQEKVDLVMHGDDYTKAKIQKYYAAPLKRGMFKMYPYEAGISTSALIERAAIVRLETLILKSTTLSLKNRETLEKSLKILNGLKKLSKKREKK